MANRPDDNTRVTVDIPTMDHKRLKMLAAFHGKTMREIVVEILGQGLQSYPECPESHEPNEITKRAIEEAQNEEGLESVDSVEELFRKLSA